jgi:hypothetical protein
MKKYSILIALALALSGSSLAYANCTAAPKVLTEDQLTIQGATLGGTFNGHNFYYMYANGFTDYYGWIADANGHHFFLSQAAPIESVMQNGTAVPAAGVPVATAVPVSVAPPVQVGGDPESGAPLPPVNEFIVDETLFVCH